MKKDLIKIVLIICCFLVSCKKSQSGANNVDETPATNTVAAKFVKLYEGRFAVKSDGTLWGWGGWSGFTDGFTTPKELLTGGVKDFKNGFAIKDDGTLWHMGATNQIATIAASCGPYKGMTFSRMPINNHSYKQMGSDANWVKVGVKGNGYIYNVFEAPSFQYTWYDGVNGCKGWHRNMEYWAAFWQIDYNYNDWKYTTTDGSLGLRSNGSLYKIAEAGIYSFPQYTQLNHPNILRLIDNNVAEVLSSNGVLVIKKVDNTIWYLDNFNTLIQVPGNWRSFTFYVNRFVAIKSDGTLWAWGGNSDGFLGDGTYTNQTSPIKISDKTNWIEVSTEYGQSYTVLDSDGNIYSWGKNDRGQLGDGTKVDKYKPTLVIAAK